MEKGQAMMPGRTSTSPLQVPQTLRRQIIRNLTSMPAGKMVPLAAIPLLREDKLQSTQLRITLEMMETVELLMNGVLVDIRAYLVPNLALERFEGMDALNRSYEGQPAYVGGDPIDYFETHVFGTPADDAIYKYMGKHADAATSVNTAFIENYNTIWNFRATNRSKDITLRNKLDLDLAPAFWQHETFRHIVPDFDQAMIDGEVALNVINSKMAVRGIGVVGASVNWETNPVTTPFRESGDVTVNTGENYETSSGIIGIRKSATSGWPDIYAELAANDITVSLSNIDLAKKTAAFARLREQYTGHSDDFIIDLLMDGISIPEQMWKQPMLIGHNRTQFGMSKRYATDAGNLTSSVVNGVTWADMVLRTPKIPTGGMVMIVAEVTPEQLFERQKDYYFHATSVDDLPQYLRDELDPEKVSVVTNDHVDIDHDTPNDTFGYAPLNHQWDINQPNIGGRFYRPLVDASFDEDRQRLWAVETENPTLSADFYLCSTMHQKPFADQTIDPFEVTTIGAAIISGNTVFGPVLFEQQANYAEIAGEAPIERIVK